jgi:hypothetical protein
VQSLERTFHRCFLPSFASFGKAVSEEKIFRNQPIWKTNCMWRPCLLMDQNEMSILYRGPSIDASYQVSYNLVKWFQRKSCFRNRPIRTNNCLWWPYLLAYQSEWAIPIETLHRCFLPRSGQFDQAVSE